MLTFAELRAREFARLDAAGHAYLDYTGTALYPESLVRAHAAALDGAILGNPHSESPASKASTTLIEDARARVLRFLDADASEYGVVFTANASGALRLVGEGYAFGPHAPFVAAADNHNSVNGVREYARRAGAAVHYLPLDASLRLDDADARLASIAMQSERGLFAFPAQSNFSGVRHPLALVRAAQSLGFCVLLDAAAYVPTSRFSLRHVPADFVALSFYKMVGYPSGVGALVARHEALAGLRRPWFSGGVVDFVSVQHRAHQQRAGVEGFEDGTPNFLAVGAVPAGLDFLDAIGVDRIGSHAVALTSELAAELSGMRHANGEPVARLYGAEHRCDRGATLAFNVVGDDGRAIPYADVEARARAARVSVRGGCFCNPGASEAAFGFPADATARCLATTAGRDWTLERFAACLDDHAVGAVRASFGAPSSAGDAERLLDVVASYRR